MQDVDTFECIGLGQPHDHPARDRCLRVALRRDHHGHRGVSTPHGLGHIGERARRGSHQQIGQRGVQTCEHHLRLRVTEARVELHHAHTPRRERETGVQQARKGCTARAHLIDGGLQHRAHRLLDEIRRGPGQG